MSTNQTRRRLGFFKIIRIVFVVAEFLGDEKVIGIIEESVQPESEGGRKITFDEAKEIATAAFNEDRLSDLTDKIANIIADK